MKNKGFAALFWPLIALIIFSGLLWAERTGVPFEQPLTKDGFLPDAAIRVGERNPDKECLLIYSGAEDEILHQNIEYVLNNTSVGYNAVDAAKDQKFDLAKYRTVILALTNLELLQPTILSIFDWTEAGGSLLVAYSPEPSVTLNAVAAKLGMINNSDLDYAVEQKVQLLTPLLPGGMGMEIVWGDNDRFGLAVQLTDDCVVHMSTVNEGKGAVPMLWERPFGKGRIVVNNNDAFAFRESRGLFIAAYSLLEDTFAYPVINASLFFLDDFPSPVPSGRNEYIDRFYQMDVGSFYRNVWFPDIQELARKYGLKYTGMLTEQYTDSVSPPFVSATDLDSYRYFGNIAQQDGAEIGLHGYNHMPLVPQSFDYQGMYGDYSQWKSEDDMAASLQEVIRFAGEVFPGAQLKTYAPPSNILSDEARRMIKERFPQINTISSVYLPDDLMYQQEFGIGKDGIIDLPRIIAGSTLTNYSRWVALNELGFHYVNSHFQHPDDALDPDRGAELGWEKMSANLDEYLQWLYGSAKGIRNLTAQQGAMAVQRYCNVTLHRTVLQDRYLLDIDGLYDEAWLLVRLNSGEPGDVQGGSLQPVSGNLYLLHATQDRVVINIKGGGQP